MDRADLIIELQGGASATRTGDDVPNMLGITAAHMEKHRLRHLGEDAPRRLIHFRQGIQSNVPPGLLVTTAALKPSLDMVAGLKLTADRLMTVAITGCSMGSWYVLLLADELRKRGIRTSIAATCDFPLFPFGTEAGAAPLPGCDQLVPSNEPEWLRLGDHTPPRAKNPPVVAGPQPAGLVGAEKLNYYQQAGNGMKLLDFRKRFSPTGSFWWWASNMGGSEIHGVLDGWFNFPVPVPAGSAADDHFHNVGDSEGMRLAGQYVLNRMGLL
jgi:hypothetical protein